jgi:hypothetical protein
MEIGTSVDAQITESALQRIAVNMTQISLDGYWATSVIQGLGRIGALCSGDRVPLSPSTGDDIQPIVQPRTSATADQPAPLRARKAGVASTNWLGVQREREPLQMAVRGRTRDKRDGVR